jgi:hypothetical protein
MTVDEAVAKATSDLDRHLEVLLARVESVALMREPQLDAAEALEAVLNSSDNAPRFSPHWPYFGPDRTPPRSRMRSRSCSPAWRCHATSAHSETPRHGRRNRTEEIVGLLG